jgi:hypothetical protein
LQTQALFRHSCSEPHVMQATPPVPHVALPLVWQTPLLSQQPFGQLIASHWHAPPPDAPAHSCQARHAVQAAPYAPHSPGSVPATQDVPLQQPVAQSLGSQ